MKKNYYEKYANIFWSNVSGFFGYLMGTQWWPLKKRVVTTSVLCILIFFFFLFVGVLALTHWIDASIFSGNLSHKSIINFRRTLEFPLDCTEWNLTLTCPTNYPQSNKSINPHRSSNTTCPDYFRWIHEDLRPWKETGITRDMVEGARRTAHFRLVIINGKVHVEKYRVPFQTRDLFTIWGILQLLRWYPGRLPDMELMFDCDDHPVIRSRDFHGPNSGPPPLFKYCSDDWSLDILFPDWSFWGWPETNIKPWRNLLKDIKEGNKRTKWKDRVPLAYWRGNPHMGRSRADLMICNLTAKDDWNTLLYIQNWYKEYAEGFKESNLGDQCTHRYKIYIEGQAWSVSQKYILACDSPTLMIMPRYREFFTRGLVPLQHYWPIRDNNKCKSLKFAVEWGNNHTSKAQAMGQEASKFVEEELKMEYVYDYMFHLLSEYSKLLRFKPRIPSMGIELCSERMACSSDGNWKKFMVDSMVTSPSHTIPCTMPPPYDPQAFKALIDAKFNSTRQVEIWENEYWDNKLNKTQQS